MLLEFSGGDDPGFANPYLRNLGFEVVPKDVAQFEVEQSSEPPRSDWSVDEISLIVHDYFDMLRSEMQGRSYSKTAHRSALMPRLNGRSNGSIEFKHQNISGVLVERGLPYISGYKPRFNYQRQLADGVDSYLIAHPTLLDEFAHSAVLNPAAAPAAPQIDPSAIFDGPPEKIVAPSVVTEPWKSRRGRKIDFVERDARNRHLGRLGEQFVVELERRRLLKKGRDDLAGRIEWVADTRGDGIGFDILSFEEADDSDRLVEVKTTGMGKYAAFYVSANEVKCSEAMAGQYHLYRVFSFSEMPRVYVLRGSLAATCQLEPIQYRAAL